MGSVTDPDVLDPVLEPLKRAWPPALWEQRLTEARARLDIIEAVEDAKAGGMDEIPALAAVGGGLHRSTYRGRLRRLWESGFAGSSTNGRRHRRKS